MWLMLPQPEYPLMAVTEMWSSLKEAQMIAFLLYDSTHCCCNEKAPIKRRQTVCKLGLLLS